MRAVRSCTPASLASLALQAATVQSGRVSPQIWVLLAVLLAVLGTILQGLKAADF